MMNAPALRHPQRGWGVLLIGLLAGVALCAGPSRAHAGGEPLSWFAYDDSTVHLDVCNIIRIGGVETTLSEFAPSAGAAWAKAHDTTMDVFVFPLKTVGVFLDGNLHLQIETGRGRVYQMLDATWLEHPQGGTAYTLIAFRRDFSLKEVSGFALVGKSKRYELKLESRLR